MSIEPDQTLLHYRIVEKLGEGGMGVVWRATDTSLDREAAIKVLPEAFAGDANRLERFEREAKLLASLSHANIASVYGLHQTDGVRFIAMELVGGEDLSQRLERGPLPVAEALTIAVQIAEGLSAAHEAGVIHRDLKPANIKLTDEGRVKVLDFGLAKMFEPSGESGAQQLSQSPTLTSAGTVAGMILGTAAYMSPEQARGRPLDRRTDIWSFGAVLFEMLTGRQPFRGEVVSDIIARILEREPPWDALPARMHPGVRRLLGRCLTKHAENRLRDAADIRIEIQELLADPLGEKSKSSAPARPPAGSTSAWVRLLPWALVAVLLAWVVAGSLLGPGPAEERLVHFEIPPPDGYTIRDFETAPDGSAVAFVAADGDGGASLWIRRLDSPASRKLPGTEEARFPFWSPDMRSVAFFSGSKLRRITLAGESVQTVADAPNGRGGTWSHDDTIVFTPDGGDVLYAVPASGGEPVAVTELQQDEFSHRFPHFVGDTRKFIFHAHSPDAQTVKRRYLGSLDSDALQPLPDGISEVYTSPGRGLYIRERTLLVQDFDTSSGRLSGEAFPLANDVESTGEVVGRSMFSVSNNGVLMYLRSPRINTRFDAYDRNGRRIETVGVAADFGTSDYAYPSLSNDGKHVVFNRQSERTSSIWVLDLERSSTRRLLEVEASSVGVYWSADDRSILYTDRRTILRLPVDGGRPQLVLDTEQLEQASSLVTSWEVDESSAGSFITFTAWDPATDLDLWLLPLDGESAPRPLAKTDGQQRRSAISPDMRWVAYESDESGRTEVYVRATGPASDEQWLVSVNGGSVPRWSADGSKLYYYSAVERVLVEVPVESKSERLRLGLPQPLFDVPRSIVNFAGVQGDRFLFQVPDGDTVERNIEVVVNWEKLLAQ